MQAKIVLNYFVYILEFITTMEHICYVYMFLDENLPPIEFQEMLQNEKIIFCPQKRANNASELVSGRFVRKSEVWWSETTGLMHKYRRDTLDPEKASIFKVSF